MIPEEELETLLDPMVTEVNEMIESLQQDGREVDFISAADIYLPLVENFLKEAKYQTLSESLAKANPHLAIELGFFTMREALRDGYITLHKSHVLEGYISIKELPREIIGALNFSQDEYKKLGY